MNKIAHILAASFGAALAVALAATLSPAPSAAWAFWALLGGGAGYLAQNPIGVLRESAKALAAIEALAARRLRHTRRRVRASAPLWLRLAMTTLAPTFANFVWAISLAFAACSFAVATMDSTTQGEKIITSVACLMLLSLASVVFWLSSSSPHKALLDFRHSFLPSDKVVRWGMSASAYAPGPLHRYDSRSHYRRDCRAEYRHARKALSGMRLGEVAFAVLCSWASFLTGILFGLASLVASVALAGVLALSAFRYPTAVAVCVAIIVGVLLWRILLRGSSAVILAAARRLHAEARLVAGAGATLGAFAGLAVSLAGGLLGVPVLAALVGAACGAVCGWGVSAASSKVVARFGVATA